MADLKFTECKKRTLPENIKEGQFTDYMFMMFRKGQDGWYRNSIFPYEDYSTFPMTTGATSGITVQEKCVVSLDKNGKAAFLAAEGIISRLNANGQALGLPEVDSVYASFALRELIKIEKCFLSEDSYFVAYLTLSACDMKPEFPVKQAVFTINFEYRKSEGPVCKSALCHAMTQMPSYPGSSMHQNCVYMGKAFANSVGYEVVLQLDCVYNKYIISADGVNVFFRTEDKVITPPEQGGIISGVGKKLMSDWGIEVCEKKISVDELEKDFKVGKIVEIFALSDTDTVIPITKIGIENKVYDIPSGKLSRKLYDSITNIRKGVLSFAHTKFERI